MKISKKFEPILAGVFATGIIGILSYLSFETSTGFWLMFSFGSTTLIVLVFYDSEFAQPANIFFGHLLSIIIGIFPIISITAKRTIKMVRISLKLNSIAKIFRESKLNF